MSYSGGRRGARVEDIGHWRHAFQELIWSWPLVPLSLLFHLAWGEQIFFTMFLPLVRPQQCSQPITNEHLWKHRQKRNSFLRVFLSGILYLTRIKASVLECGCVVKYSLTPSSISYSTLCLKSDNHTTGISQQALKKTMKSEWTAMGGEEWLSRSPIPYPSAQQPAQACDGQAGTLEAHAMFSWATAINNSKTIPICNMSCDFCNVNFIKIRTFLLLCGSWDNAVFSI